MDLIKEEQTEVKLREYKINVIPSNDYKFIQPLQQPLDKYINYSFLCKSVSQSLQSGSGLTLDEQNATKSFEFLHLKQKQSQIFQKYSVGSFYLSQDQSQIQKKQQQKQRLIKRKFLNTNNQDKNKKFQVKVQGIVDQGKSEIGKYNAKIEDKKNLLHPNLYLNMQNQNLQEPSQEKQNEQLKNQKYNLQAKIENLNKIQREKQAKIVKDQSNREKQIYKMIVVRNLIVKAVLAVILLIISIYLERYLKFI